MSTLHGASRALRTGFGVALLAALALVSGVSGAAADGPKEPADSSLDEPAVPQAPTGDFTCSMFGGLALGTLRIIPGPGGTCTAQIFSPELPGSNRIHCFFGPGGSVVCPDCESLRQTFGCPVVP